ncbi:hypothetical protein PsorP6_003211 [Peronosclerospora sorghi]|uniref:Uncharacterized protein n=1 Tax=Peronosclerospora sorghi TaxID=230839 RepID=A0ACC0VKY7_9STRA|nr:hypothetical protein PsorP6_003211 [Peronosclerospora sorghi]
MEIFSLTLWEDEYGMSTPNCIFKKPWIFLGIRIATPGAFASQTKRWVDLIYTANSSLVHMEVQMPEATLRMRLTIYHSPPWWKIKSFALMMDYRLQLIHSIISVVLIDSNKCHMKV